MKPAFSHEIDEWPLTKELFAKRFSAPGSTIIEHDVYELHARQILVDDRNFLGLFALDTLLSNRQGQFRHDDITPKSNHPLLVFFQIQTFVEADKEESNNSGKYLPDRPDLDQIAALLHDEGEDIDGFTKTHLAQSMHQFINNIHNYVTQHNIDYPDMILDPPTEQEIIQMRSDIPEISDTFDVLTKGYKGQEKKDYIQYHRDVLKNARATRIKIIDKPCNGATFVYRSKAMLNGVTGSTEEYREWAIDQIHRMKDIYQNQNFLDESNSGRFNSQSDYHNRGFVRAAMIKHPESAPMIQVMGEVIDSQIILYDHNIANERLGYQSDEPPINARTYQKMSLAPSVNLIEITQNRFEEVSRLDKEKKKGALPENVGLFNIKFPTQKPTGHMPIPLKSSGLHLLPA